MIPVNNPQEMSQMQVQGGTSGAREGLQAYREQLLECMGLNQFSAQQAAQTTATAAAIMDKQRQAHNLGLASRLQHELCHQLVEKLFHILAAKGYWRNKSLKGSGIRIQFAAPVNEGQSQEDVSRLIKFSQAMEGIAGPQMATQALTLGLDISAVPSYVANKLGVDQTLIRNDLQKQQMLQAAQQQSQGPQQPQESPQDPSGQLPTQGASNGQTGSQPI